MTSGNDLLISIAEKNPDLINTLIRSVDAQIVFQGRDDDKSTLNNLQITRYSLEQVSVQAAPEHKNSVGMMRRLRYLLTDALILAVGVGAGAAYIKKSSEAMRHVSNVTSRVGYPLSPEDQAKAILNDPEALKNLATHFGSEEGVARLTASLQSGDSVQKAQAITTLLDAMKTSLQTVTKGHVAAAKIYGEAEKNVAAQR